MPGERHAARRWLDREERQDRQNARIIDKITVALPRELDAQQRRMLVAAFAERVTRGRAAWLAAIHQSGEDAHNPHAHIVIRDRDPETGRRVALLSEKGACREIRLLWEQAVNAALEALGSPQRVTRLSHAARGIETPPQRHRGPQGQGDEREEENKPDVSAPAPTVGLAFETASGKRPRRPRPFVSCGVGLADAAQVQAVNRHGSSLPAGGGRTQTGQAVVHRKPALAGGCNGGRAPLARGFLFTKTHLATRSQHRVFRPAHTSRQRCISAHFPCFG